MTSFEMLTPSLGV
uniref:Uncharacterized protein n=1 Tax=Anguilla anguilla TaxID=7936 RepID=A0A0E9W7C7_ANGAN